MSRCRIPFHWAFRVQVTPEQRAAAVAAIYAKLGARYGIRALLEDGARELLLLPIGMRWQPQRFTCSGLIAWAYAQAGVRLTYAVLPSPGDLANSPLLVGARPWQR